MIPDKIYIKEFDGEVSKMWSNERSTKTLANVQHEYIRKDALIEWAKEKNTRLDGTGGDYTQGYIHAMIDLIEKLNSM